MSEVAVKRAGCEAKSQLVFEAMSLCRYTCMQPYLPLVSGFVDDALRNTVPSISDSVCQCCISVVVSQGEVANYVCV